MTDRIGAAAIGAAAPVATGLFGQMFYKKNARFQQELTKELMDKQVQSEKDLYDYQMNDQRGWNEYSEQLGKMSDVGMNPLLTDGSFTGAGSASIGSAGLGSAPVNETPHFDFVSSIANALKSKELDIKKRETDSNINKQNQEIENLKIERDVLLSKKDLTQQETENLKSVNRQINQQIENDYQRVKNEVEQVGLLRSRLAFDKSQFEFNKWAKEKELKQNDIQNQITGYRAQTERYNYGLAYKTLEFEKGKFDKEFNIAKKRAENDIRLNNFEALTKYIDSFKSLGVSGQAMYGLVGILNAVKDKLSSLGSEGKDFDVQKRYQNMADQLINELNGISVFDENFDYNYGDFKNWSPEMREYWHKHKK